MVGPDGGRRAPRKWARWLGVVPATVLLAGLWPGCPVWAQVAHRSRAVGGDAEGLQTTIVSARQSGLTIQVLGVLTAPRPAFVEAAVVSQAARNVAWRRRPVVDTGMRPMPFKTEIPVPEVDGERVTVVVRVGDASGEVDLSPATHAMVVDAFPPSVVRLEIDGGAPATSKGYVLLRSVVRGATRMRVASSPGELVCAAWQPMRAETTVAIGPTEGAHVIAAQFADDAGNETDPGQGEVRVLVDRTAPRALGAEAEGDGFWVKFDEPVVFSPSGRLKLNGSTVVASFRPAQRQDTVHVGGVKLTSGAQYIAQLAADSGVTDLARNSLLPATLTFRALDEEPPSPPASLIATSQEALVQLKWPPAKDDVGVVAYRVYRSEGPMPQSPSPEFAMGLAYEPTYIDDSGVSNANYYYAVTALDSAGNESLLSPQVRIRVGVIGRYHGESREDTNICKDCHGAAGASESETARLERARCYGCHDGTGSQHNIQAALGETPGNTRPPTSAHPIADDRIRCSSCHTPHRSSLEVPRLLVAKAPDGTRVQGGTRFCLTCHWEASPAEPGVLGTTSRKRVDAKAFADSAHAALPDGSGAAVTCSVCHLGHSSEEPALLAQDESRLCLGCHDASSRTGPLGWKVSAQFSARSHHAVEGTSTDGLAGASLTCSSCHDSHSVRRGAIGVSDLSARVIDPGSGLAWSRGSLTEFCLTCHRGTEGTASVVARVGFPIVDPARYPLFAGWDKQAFRVSIHATSPRITESRRTCGGCHQAHGSDNPRLLVAGEDTTSQAGACLSCHDGSVPGAGNIAASLTKRSGHPTLVRGGQRPVHRDVEGPFELGYNGGVADMRHAECADCHDVHTAGSGRRAAGSPLAGPALAGVSGVNVRLWPRALMAGPGPTAFEVIRLEDGVSEEWQLCFKCHSNFTTLPPLEATGVASRDIAAEFNPNNGSYHSAVLAPKNAGRIAFVEGSQWTATSRMACTDCHGDDPSSEDGTQPLQPAAGAHGSSNPALLKRPFDGETGLPGTQGDLCFICHDRDVYGGGDPSIEASRTGFSDGARNLHNVGAAGAGHKVACVSCHSPVVHGAVRRALLVSSDETVPYRADGAPGVRLAGGLAEPGRWIVDSCAHEGACHR